MTPDVQEAIAELQRAFAGHRVEVLETGDGGARVLVHDLELGTAFAPTTSWVGFTIPYNYPRADVYPHFVDAELARADGRALPTPPLNAGHQMPGFNRPAVMVSRRSNRWDPRRDTAVLKLMRILAWFADQDGTATQDATA
jgi:Prokaryotic E2 family E